MTRNSYAEISARIVAQLESGTAPWAREWSKTAGQNTVANAVTLRPYSGVNVILLWSAMQASGFTVPRFLTYKQAAALKSDTGEKAFVRKGEHGTRIFFVKRLTKTDTNAAGDEETRSFSMMREYTVFNVSQIENLPSRMLTTQPGRIWNHDARDETIDAFVTCTGADIREGQGQAMFVPSLDMIGMPAFAAFNSADAFYATLFHELGHWSGGKARLDRNLSGRFGSESYAAEELVAELNSAFICAEFGIDNINRHASYIASWIRLLKSDPKAFFVAAAAAQKAADYLRGLALRDEETESDESLAQAA